MAIRLFVNVGSFFFLNWHPKPLPGKVGDKYRSPNEFGVVEVHVPSLGPLMRVEWFVIVSSLGRPSIQIQVDDYVFI